jgi:hypothetical protein
MSRLSAALLAVALLGACAHNRAQDAPAPSPSNSFLLPRSELSPVLQAAADGDVAAMERLFFHYAVALGEDETGLLWRERAGDAGSEESRQFVLCHYSRHSSATIRERASQLAARWGVAAECHRGT